MQIIISSAKKMRVDNDDIGATRLPVFLSKTEELLAVLRALDYKALQTLWQCNDAIAELNYNRLQKMDLRRNLTPAVFSYDGLQYQHIAPNVLDEAALEYLDKHLKILSGFYGILSAFDGVVPYRLEMQARLACGGKKNLYAFWGRSLYDELVKKDNEVLNLASREYSKAVEPYVDKNIRFVTCIFGTLNNGKVKVRATEAKMARGEMVRRCAENNVQHIDDVKNFTVNGYSFASELSTDTEFVFLK
mgnify:FL=1